MLRAARGVLEVLMSGSASKIEKPDELERTKPAVDSRFSVRGLWFALEHTRVQQFTDQLILRARTQNEPHASHLREFERELRNLVADGEHDIELAAGAVTEGNLANLRNTLAAILTWAGAQESPIGPTFSTCANNGRTLARLYSSPSKERRLRLFFAADQNDTAAHKQCIDRAFRTKIAKLTDRKAHGDTTVLVLDDVRESPAAGVSVARYAHTLLRHPEYSEIDYVFVSIDEDDGYCSIRYVQRDSDPSVPGEFQRTWLVDHATSVCIPFDPNADCNSRAQLDRAVLRRTS